MVLNKTTEINLTYPFSWKVSFHPLSERIERKTQDWLTQLGVIHDEKTLEKFQKLTVWAYAGWSFPQGDEERMETIMAFLALWIFYDDVIEEGGDGILPKIKAAIGGEPPTFPGGGPHYRGWWELGQRYRRVMSPAWLHRHAERFEEWVLAVHEEFESASLMRERNELPSADEHLTRRVFSVGMIPCIDFIEYQMGWELPEEILKEPETKALEWISSEVVAITNDLVSFQKDHKQRWCNLVSCIAREKHISLVDAFREAEAIHNQQIILFSELGQKLIAKHPDVHQLPEWLERMRNVMYGFARWHVIATRYNTLHTVGNDVVKISVREFDDMPHHDSIADQKSFDHHSWDHH